MPRCPLDQIGLKGAGDKLKHRDFGLMDYERMAKAGAFGEGLRAQARRVLSLVLCLIMLFAPATVTFSHGPAAYIAAEQAEAAVSAHGHSHDFDMAGAGHKLSDHDHGSMVMLDAATQDFATGPRLLALSMDDFHAEGAGSEGPRRPPRGAVL